MDSSVSAAQIVVEYDGVDGGGGTVGKSVKKYVKKSSKGRKSVKKSKNLKDLKSPKGHRFGGTFTEAPIFRQRTRASVTAL